MKKVLGAMSKFIFGLFGIAVLALLMTLTYGALQKLFPNSFSNQMWGLVMFDIAAMCWAVAFVFQSKSTIQYAAAGLGFIVAFVGTLGMVAAEVMLSGQSLTPANTVEIGRWMVYGFIVVTAIHAGLIYAHHASAPEIHEQINVGIARGEIVTEAITQATKILDEQKQDLAYSIRNDIISKAKRDLGLIEADPRMPFLPAQPQPIYPVVTPQTTPTEKTPGFLSNPTGWLKSKFGKNDDSTRIYEKSLPDMSKIAASSDYEMAWRELPDGGRARQWCKYCRDAGNDWLSSVPCEHILNAKADKKISHDKAVEMLERIISEPITRTGPLTTHLTDDQRQAWIVTKFGTRTRMWCVDCRDKGDLGWTSPEPCDHVILAKSGREVSMEEGRRILVGIPELQEGAKPANDFPL
jgi:hypothetical protein